MARAGYCSACGNYVFLRPDGGCSNGHGAEYVSNQYDVPDATPVAPPAYQQQAPPVYQQPAYQQPTYQQPAAPYAQPAAYAAPVAAPKKKRTGLIIGILAVALLLLCGCGAGVGMFAGLIPNPFASPEHQKVAVAGDFFKAVSTADAVGLAKSIPTDAAVAADPAFWLGKLAEAGSTSTLKSTSWSNDVLTQVYVDSDGAERSIVFTALEGDKVKAVVTEAGGSANDAGLLTMTTHATGWKVLALGTETEEFIRFDAATVKKIQEESK
jgi:hypothetical protein